MKIKSLLFSALIVGLGLAKVQAAATTRYVQISTVAGSPSQQSGSFNVAGGTVGILNTTLIHYQRPVVETILASSATMVAVSTNSSTAQTTVAIFPDGEVRTVTENISTTQLYRACTLSNLASFGSSSTIRGGLLIPGIATNQFYTGFLVKVSSTGLTDKFVLVFSTYEMVQDNISTLNSYMGANSYLYAGTIRRGDQSGKNNEIQPWFNSGNRFTLYNANPITSSQGQMTGVLLADNAAATTITWSYSSGMAGAVIPRHFKLVAVEIARNTPGATARSYQLRNSAATTHWFQETSTLSSTRVVPDLPPSQGFALASATDATAMSLTIIGWVDDALSGPDNPF